MKHFIRPRPGHVDIQSGILRSILKQEMPGLDRPFMPIHKLPGLKLVWSTVTFKHGYSLNSRSVSGSRPELVLHAQLRPGLPIAIRDNMTAFTLLCLNDFHNKFYVSRPDLQRSGQPTCFGYRRKDIEEGEEEISDETLRLSDAVKAELKSRLSVRSFRDLENERENGNRRKGNNERRNNIRWYFKDLWRIVGMASRTLFLGVVLLITPGKIKLLYYFMEIIFFISTF